MRRRQEALWNSSHSPFAECTQRGSLFGLRPLDKDKALHCSSVRLTQSSTYQKLSFPTTPPLTHTLTVTLTLTHAHSQSPLPLHLHLLSPESRHCVQTADAQSLVGVRIKGHPPPAARRPPRHIPRPDLAYNKGIEIATGQRRRRWSAARRRDSDHPATRKRANSGAL